MADKRICGPIRPSTRRLIQLYSALLHNAHLRGFMTGRIYMGAAKNMCAPGLNCYSCPGAVAACPLGAIQNALAASGHRAPWFVMGILMLFGLIAGRTICGWLCPMGLIQELLHRVPGSKIRKSPVTRALTGLKYVILAVFVIAIPLGYGLRHGLQIPAFCKYLCPAGTFEGAAALLANPVNDDMYPLLGLLFTRKAVVMLAIGLLCVFCHRAFCRFLCPLGALYGLFNRLSLIGVRVDESSCTGCGACIRHCEMDVRRVGDRECIQCARCMDVCAHGAISVKCGKATLLDAKNATAGRQAAGLRFGRRKRVAWIIALFVLVFALIWFNFIRPA